jgi:hypothetical protein
MESTTRTFGTLMPTPFESSNSRAAFPCPSADAAGALLEISVVGAQGSAVVVHAMAARERFLR